MRSIFRSQPCVLKAAERVAGLPDAFGSGGVADARAASTRLQGRIGQALHHREQQGIEDAEPVRLEKRHQFHGQLGGLGRREPKRQIGGGMRRPFVDAHHLAAGIVNALQHALRPAQENGSTG